MSDEDLKTFMEKHFARCAQDPVFFITQVCKTVDEKDKPNPVKKIPDALYIRKLVEEIHSHDKIIVEKSRQMMVTWVINAYILWDSLFSDFRRWFIQSNKEGDSDAQLSRIAQIMSELPEWEKAPFNRIYCKMEFESTKSEIIAVAQNPDAYRSYTGNVFIDEDEKQPQYKECLTAALPITMGGGKIISVGTVKGYNDKYAVMSGEAWGRPGEKHDFVEHCHGFTAWTNSGGWRCLRLHYSADPNKTAEWLKINCKGWDDYQIQQEMEINRNVTSGSRVYMDFRYDVHVKNLKFMPYATLYRGWDFGFHHPAVVFFQIDDQDRVLVLAELMGKDITAHQFFEEAINFSNKHFKTRNVTDWGDIAGTQKTDKGKTSIQIARDFGINIRARKREINHGLETIRELLRKRPDGNPAIFIDPSCDVLIRGMAGGYAYEEEDKKDMPLKDGYYDHLQDALRYGICGVINLSTLKRNFGEVGNKQFGIDKEQNINHALSYIGENNFTGYGVKRRGSV